MNRPPRILLISSDEFSGVRPALMAAFQRAGCDVVYVRQSLRELGYRRYWHLMRMTLDALLQYGGSARAMMERTRSAFIARSRACKAIVDRHPDTDVVLLIAANYNNYWGDNRPSAKQFVIYTDHMNLISKALPDHGFALEERRTAPQWNELEGEILRAQDHVFVMGSHVKTAITSAYGISEARISAVGAGPGLDLDIERDGGLRDYTSRRILFVGKLAEKKGLGVLIKALPRVRAVFPDTELHTVAGRHASGPGIVLHEQLPATELKELFYRSTIFAMPAFKEPLGLVFLEAMWSKLACISTTTGPMPELIMDGDNGYLVERGDHEALADRIIALLSDPERTRRMGERGYERAKEYWHWDLVAQRMLRVLQR
jgi:glycosyltransferase involved in cell wall biosynthesis